VPVPGSVKVALALSAAGTLYLGILPMRFLDWTTEAALNALR
jgi:hypothetical protein